tara:strand:+ start:7514 stop:7969 length:456 start_codon:yes stop_codon:yes gene_type:complete
MNAKIFETPEDRLREIQLYEQVALEIVNNQQVAGVWAQALSQSSGDESAAKALYIKLRVQMIKDELAYAQKIQKIEQQEQRKERAEELRQSAMTADSCQVKPKEKRKKQEEKEKGIKATVTPEELRQSVTAAACVAIIPMIPLIVSFLADN